MVGDFGLESENGAIHDNAGSNQKTERFECAGLLSHSTSSGKMKRAISDVSLYIHPAAARHRYKAKHPSCKNIAKLCGKYGTTGTLSCLSRYILHAEDGLDDVADLSAMQLKTLPETPAQAKPAVETTERKQEDMLACHLDHMVTQPMLSLHESEDG